MASRGIGRPLGNDFYRLSGRRGVLRGRMLRIDAPLILSLFCLAMYGLLVLFSASGENIADVERQGAAIVIAFIVMIGVAQLEVEFFRRGAPMMFVGGLGVLVIVLIFGSKVNGAKAWLDLPGLPSFQPSELEKFLVPMMLAWYMSKRTLPPRFRDLVVCGLIILLPAALILLQNDTGTALMVIMSGVFVVLLAGISWRIVISAAVLLMMASPAWYIFLAQAHQKNRILTFFDPYRDPTGAGYNIIQSQIAIGSGGIQGKGWLNGAQSQLDFIPESNTDFILAVLAEEFGLLGVLFLIVLYLAVLARGFYIAVTAQDTFSRLLAGGIILTFFFYAFVNMAMVSGLMPVVGLPLPLVSKGGTSIVTLLAGFGILMSIHTHKRVLPR
ncbi:MAG: rod shape-determining protein RodA [Pseudomonadales bacterium]|nr:rod shape-determining protein RodA [Pseudomonadales bacterium]MCP5330877.1 rod shape-determining protein RodA [Pseudomonadales bacterium]MCP5343257.1 rod shape-determining protein RodA [Pseudomonadales bacterium]